MDLGIGRCGEFPCTGLNNVIVKDLDGSFFSKKSTVIPKNDGVANQDECFVDTEQNSYNCDSTSYALLVFESV